MLKYTLRRLAFLIPKLLLITIILFAALEWMPGDALSRKLGPEMYNELSEVQKDAMRESMGLNDPAPVRYLRWLGDICKGDLGYSMSTKAKISDMLANTLPYTFELSLWALLFSTALGMTMGFLCAVYKNKWVDNLFQIFGVVGTSVPDFFLGVCCVLFFSLELNWFPSGGRIDPMGRSRIWVLILPIFTLTMMRTAGSVRSNRAYMVDVMEKDYVKTARSKGLSETVVNIKHVLRIALIPQISGMIQGLTVLISGSMIIEQVFNYMGVGTVSLAAQGAGDSPVVLTMTLITATVSLLCSTLADIGLAAMDPRIRLGE